MMQASDSAQYPVVSNFRDAGGLPLGDGLMARGRIYRSAAPGRLDASSAAALKRLGVATIVDLRGVGEAGARPTIAPQTESFGIVPAPVEPRTSAAVRTALADGSATASMMRQLMIQSYRSYVLDMGDAFGLALNALLTSESPALVHCTAGKDRTGFIVAVIQSALGAHDDDVYADYLRTNRDWDRASVAGHLPLESEAVAPILVADADYLAAAFEAIRSQDGDVIAFIGRATRGRVSQRELDSFIDRGQHS